MTRMQKIRSIFVAIVTILASIYMIVEPDDGLITMALILSIALVTMGLKYLIYYFTMARHMVGGKGILFYGLIVFDFGLFTLSLSNIPKLYLVLYLVVINGFSAAVTILRGLNAKKMHSASWRLSISHGILNLALAFFCIIFVRSTSVVVYVYCFGLIYSSIIRIISAFRKTAVVYIQ